MSYLKYESYDMTYVSDMSFKVVFCGRNVEAGEKIAAENKATFIKCDVTKHEEVEIFFKKLGQLYCILFLYCI